MTEQNIRGNRARGIKMEMGQKGVITQIYGLRDVQRGVIV